MKPTGPNNLIRAVGALVSSTPSGNDPPALDPIIELVISDLCGFSGLRLRAQRGRA